MNVRQRKRWMLAAAAVLAGGGGAVVALGLAVAVDAPSARPTAADPAGHRTDDPDPAPGLAARGVSLADLRRVASIDLRRPLYDPPQPEADRATAATAADPNAGLPVTLIGTANETGHSMAILRRTDQKIEVRRAGESFETPTGVVRVIDVTDRRVELQFAGRRHTLAMPEPPREAF